MQPNQLVIELSCPKAGLKALLHLVEAGVNLRNFGGFDEAGEIQISCKMHGDPVPESLLADIRNMCGVVHVHLEISHEDLLASAEGEANGQPDAS